MFCSDFNNGPTFITTSFKSLAYSIDLTGFSMIFIYLLFHLASFKPLTTLAFSLRKLLTSYPNFFVYSSSEAA